MPFLIVETIEKGSKKLSICPEGWVTNGNLNWPIKKSSKKCKIEDLEPQENWLQMQCIIKRRNLNSYDAAEEELNKMVEKPETDQEGYVNVSQPALLNENYNHVAEQLASKKSTNASTAAKSSIHTSGGAINDDLIEDILLVTGSDHNVNSLITEDAGNIQEDNYNNLLINQNILSENQIKIIDNQMKIMRTLATISVKLDKIASNREEPPTSDTFVTELSYNLKKSPANSKLAPINNLNDLQRMENKLRDAETKAFYKDLYSVFCTPGKKGEICAFQLIDVLFTREFLVQCSWSGSARGSGTKISIKLFQEVLGFFFELVHECDPSYTVDKNNDFFKSVVKNAVKRTKSKLERSSTPRRVQKRKPATTQNKTVKKCKKGEDSEQTPTPGTSHKNLLTVEVIEKNVRNEIESMAENKPTVNKELINEETDAVTKNDEENVNLDGNNENEPKDANAGSQLI